MIQVHQAGLRSWTPARVAVPPRIAQRRGARPPGVDGPDADQQAINTYMRDVAQRPLLSAAGEVELARRIQCADRQLSRLSLSHDFVLRQLADILAQVHHGERRLDRTLNVATADMITKRRLAGILAIHLKTLTHLLSRNRDDFRAHDQPPDRFHRAPRSLAADCPAARKGRGVDRRTGSAIPGSAADRVGTGGPGNSDSAAP